LKQPCTFMDLNITSDVLIHVLTIPPKNLGRFRVTRASQVNWQVIQDGHWILLCFTDGTISEMDPIISQKSYPRNHMPNIFQTYPHKLIPMSMNISWL
jgi:hypothetical protein